uniref:Uncharacterized protein n=1 Tax=Spongospora subterranea TaxID=70186 RepID=A0A0H5QPL7_9EUKA|eukprot:CRZ03988.1 hypothetical protein [Spongospora subterranea]
MVKYLARKECDHAYSVKNIHSPIPGSQQKHARFHSYRNSAKPSNNEQSKVLDYISGQHQLCSRSDHATLMMVLKMILALKGESRVRSIIAEPIKVVIDPSTACLPVIGSSKMRSATCVFASGRLSVIELSSPDMGVLVVYD